VEVLISLTPVTRRPPGSTLRFSEASCEVVGSGGLRTEPVGSSGYYESKNRLLLVAAGEVLVFVDSDVLPADGWLGRMILPFDDPAVTILAGRTIVGPLATRWDKAVSETWFVDPRPRSGVEEVSHFYANDVAMRASVFRGHPYDLRPEEFRGACGRLAIELITAGHTIRRDNDALCMHMSPSFLRDFTTWYLLTGRDHAMSRRELRGVRYLAESTGQVARGMAEALRNAVQRRRCSELDLASALLTLPLSIYAWSTWMVGAILGRVQPRRFAHLV
jgi:hypothetical protein